jgi:hypothetical protein
MTGSNGDKERRKSPRIMIDLPMDYRVISIFRTHGGLIEEMGEEGFRMRCTRELPVGTKLNITVLFPERFELNKLEARTEVIWKDLSWKVAGKGCQYGLRILQIEGEDLRKLRQLLGERSRGVSYDVLLNTVYRESEDAALL